MSPPGWRVAVDRGGTFTDVIAAGPAGEIRVRKLLSADGVELRALRELFGDHAGERVVELRVGTTVATNALLTRRGSATALVVTRGHRDLLHIRHQARPRIFELFVSKAEPLCARTVEVHERVLADGTVEQPPDLERLRPALERLRADGIRSLAVVLVHGYLHQDHERQVGGLARSMGFDRVTLSCEIAPEIGLVERAQTAVADAFVTPVLEAWTRALVGSLPSGCPPLFMKSSGGLASRSSFGGVDAVLSGPAGGVVACAHIARQLGLSAVLGFDMGGTSTDVSRWAGKLERRSTLEVAGARLRAPVLDIVTVAAGGGSVLRRTDGRFRAGPDSSGADPGPACYGRGGPASLTDANVVLGRVAPDLFPAVFGPAGDAELDAQASRRALTAFGEPETAAAGFLAVANATMAAAISELSTERGHDPAGHALVAFGGAAPQHACAIAELLGIRQVVIHPLAGVLSAHGIQRAQRLATRSLPVMQAWHPDLAARLESQIVEAVHDARAELDDPAARVSLRWDLRYEGSDTALPATDPEAFEAAHQRLFGFTRSGVPVEAVQLRVEALSGRSTIPPTPPAAEAQPWPEPLSVRRVGFPDGQGGLAWHATEVFRRGALPPGGRRPGPLMLADAVTTILVDPGWSAEVDSTGAIRLRAGQRVRRPRRGPERDPVRLELFWRRFMSIATRMGETLRRVAWSVNIKERLDYSCAVFDAEGRLVANAPHIPVHLGAMGETVRALRARLGAELRPGRSWAVNDPFEGGSHLPDITVITPVFREGAGAPFAWVANRGHHADVGGVTPGSMPPFSRSLAEEGVRLRDLLLVDDGVWRRGAVHAALGTGPHPARDPETCLADLQAQVAANTLGARLLEELAALEGLAAVAAYMGHIQDNGDEAVQAWLASWSGGARRFADALDDGTPIRVSLSVEPDGRRRSLVVDFAGTGPASAGNLNAPPAVVRAAVLYVLRCVVARQIPLNEGCLRAVRILLPEGCLLRPPPGAAVVGGNVETSQRLVDVLLGALGVAAASQGTMNNLTFGDAGRGYYETVCGGAGAGQGRAGADAVHTHMTNTRITDTEVLERRQPVVVREFLRRPGSGGEGRWPGGDGVRRTLEFRAPLSVSLLSQRRTRAPFGLAGGGDASPGRAELRRRDGTLEPLGGCFEVSVQAGDRLVLETPGGGGFGPPDGQ